MTNYFANKALGQHFLKDKRAVQRILEAAKITPSDIVVEVGPGPGALTHALLATKPKKLVLIEKDDRFAALHQEELTSPDTEISVLHQDALKARLSDIGDNIVLVSNLPYNVGTALLTQWIEDDLACLSRCVLMFQKEVAERLVAHPGTKDYGRLSVLCQATTHVRKLFDVAPGAFSPPPKVTSSVISVVPKTPLLPSEIVKTLGQLTHAAFSQRRKMVRSSLGAFLQKTPTLLSSLDIPETLRAENIAVEQYVAMAESLHS